MHNLTSTDPKDIGIKGDPPLCRSCSHLVNNRLYIEVCCIIVAESVERVRISAQLGCYICSLFRRWMREKDRSYSLNDLPGTVATIALRSTDSDTGRGFTWMFTAYDKDLEPLGHLSLEMKREAGKHRYHLHVLPLTITAFNGLRPTILEQKQSIEVVSEQDQKWIAECLKSHREVCGADHNENGSGYKPTRLLYVGTDLNNDVPRLCLSANLPDKISYMTLSHCWGKIEIFRPLVGNMKELLKQVPLPELPNVFREAIELTRHLGIQYLWIDSLCIIQDSPKDWASESVTMNNVYRYSYLNIASTGCTDGRGSLWNPCDQTSILPRKLALNIRDPESITRKRVSKGEYYLVEGTWFSQIFMSPLISRGWVFQEMLLAPRIISFRWCTNTMGMF